MICTGPKPGSVSCRLGMVPRHPGDQLKAKEIGRSETVFKSHVSDIKTISVTKGGASIKKAGDAKRRLITLPAGQEVTLEIGL